MSFSDSSVARSDGIISSAVNLRKKQYEMRTGTLAGLWDLERTESSKAEEAEWIKSVDQDSDSLLDEDDHRRKVDVKDYSEGGKYRSIVKMFVKYEYSKGTWAMGTAWLIRPDLMVTAGHMVFSYRPNYGRAVMIKAYIGYHGKHSINTPGVQFRTGTRCVTTGSWLTQVGGKPFDVGFIKLNRPFDGVTPIEYMETPADGYFDIGVVGYPGDLEHHGEQGGHMYEMFHPERYNLPAQEIRMLQYNIDTYGGNSGSPVLRRKGNRMVSIGVHVYGGQKGAASLIGLWGNPFQDLIPVVDMEIPDGGDLHMINAPKQDTGLGVENSDYWRGNDDITV